MFVRHSVKLQAGGKLFRNLTQVRVAILYKDITQLNVTSYYRFSFRFRSGL